MDWPLLAPLPAEEQQAVLAAARTRNFAKGEVLFHEDDPADALHLVVSGHLAVQVSTPDGERATLNILKPGDHVGELALIPGPEPARRSASVVALEPTQTRVLPVSAFRDLCDRYPRVQMILVDLLAQRVRELSARTLELMYVGLDRRLYRMLLDLSATYGEVVPLTQDQLSDLVGGTRQTVNQTLQKLVEQRVIELGRGRVTVLDRATLHRKSGR